MKCFKFVIAIFAILSILACGEDSSKSEKTDADVIVDTDGDKTPSNDEDKKPVDEEKDDDPVVDEEKDDEPVVDEEKDDIPVVDEDDDEDVVVVDPCKNVTCGGNGTCAPNTDGDPECTCNDGFRLDKENPLNCEAIPCHNEDCGGNGTCSETESGTAQCACDTGFLIEEGNALNCIPGYIFPNNSFEQWEKRTVKIPETNNWGELVVDGDGNVVFTDQEEEIDAPVNWSVGYFTSPTKSDRGDAGFAAKLFTDLEYNKFLTSSPVDCGPVAPKTITFDMKGAGTVLAILTINPKDNATRKDAEISAPKVYYYKLDSSKRLFSNMKTGPGGSDVVYFEKNASGGKWPKYTILLGDEIKELWKVGNTMKLTFFAGKGKSVEGKYMSFDASIDNVEIGMEAPACVAHSDCTDSSKPFCNTNPDEETFLTCTEIPSCVGKTIKDLKTLNGVKIGDTVNVCEAVLTSPIHGRQLHLAYAADPEGGDSSAIQLKDMSFSIFSDEKIGTKVRLKGVYSEHSSEGVYLEIKELTKLPGEKIPTPVETTPIDCKDEKFQHSLITLKNVSVTALWRDVKIDGDIIISTYGAYQLPKPFLGDTITSITGNLHYQYGAWELLLRSADDVVMSESPCKDQTCGGFGTCSVENSSAKCTCDSGYENEDGKPLNCVKIDPCENVTCGDNAQCAPNAEGVGECTCKDGFENDPATDFECVAKTSEDLKDPFISEYIEGGNQNKALEIYNPNDKEISLEGYSVKSTHDNTEYADRFVFTAENKIPAKGVFVVSHTQAAPAILAHAKLTNGSIPWNGNDAVGLFKGETMIDVVGVPNEASIKDVTLVRKSEVAQGNTTFDKEGEWIVNVKDTLDFIGAHPGKPAAATEPVE